MAVYYHIVSSEGGKDAIDIALNISREMYKLSRPVKGSNTTEFLLVCIPHPDGLLAALEIDDSCLLPIRKAAKIEDLLALYKNTKEEKKIIKDKVDAKKEQMIAVSEFVPIGIKKYTITEIEALGFLKNEAPI